MKDEARWTQIDRRTLRAWPLPEVDASADKEERGQVLVIAGSREIPGAAQLAAVAALRAGAGKLVIATAQSAAGALAVAVPEARVIALPESTLGSFTLEAVALLESTAKSAACALIGPGLMDAAGTSAWVGALLPLLRHAPVVLDAVAMDVSAEMGPFDQPVLLTPHAGEMAHLLGIDKDEVLSDPQEALNTACRRWNAVVALKGSTTLIGSPGGERWRHDASDPGLATSGSGDVLAGLIAGLAARGADLAQACAWGVALHGMAGTTLSRKMGRLGYLARELSAQVPALMKQFRPIGSGASGRPG